MSIKIEEILSSLDNKCLYCKKECKLSAFGEASVFMDIYNCEFCNEFYSIISGINKFKSLVISCKDLKLTIDTDDYTMILSDLDSKKNGVQIPEFEISFDNKEKLYEKLKIYATFS